jgi:hypothetical protein
MADIYWDKPVSVANALIFGPREAWEFMSSHWPHEKDLNFATALEAVLAAIAGRLSPDLAREHFEAALSSSCADRTQITKV